MNDSWKQREDKVHAYLDRRQLDFPMLAGDAAEFGILLAIVTSDKVWPSVKHYINEQDKADGLPLTH